MCGLCRTNIMLQLINYMFKAHMLNMLFTERDMRCDFQDNACGYRQLGDSTSQVWDNLYDVQIINQNQGNSEYY